MNRNTVISYTELTLSMTDTILASDFERTKYESPSRIFSLTHTFRTRRGRERELDRH